MPQENWFALGRLLTTRRRRAGAAVVERLDVRVPDAAAGDAELRGHAARPDLRGAVERQIALRPPARRALGHLRVRLQHHRRAAQLPVPRVRRAGPRAQARPRRGPGRRALRDDDGADGRRPRPPCANLQRLGRRGPRRHATASTRRSTTRRRACRAARSSAVVRSYMAHHQGMGLLALAYLLLDRPMQRRFAADPRAAGDAAAAAGARAARRARSTRTWPSAPAAAAASPATETPLRVIRDARHAVARGAAAVQRPLPRDADQRRRRLQPLAGPGGHALARGRAPRDAWGSFCYLRDVETRRRSGRPRTSRRCGRPDELRGDLLRGPRRVPPPRPGHRHPHRDRASRPRTTSSCAGCASPTAAARAARSS